MGQRNFQDRTPVFTSFCYRSIFKFTTVRNVAAARLYFHRRLSVILFTGGVCPSACWDTHSLGRHPLGRHTPPDRYPLGRYPLGRYPLGRHPQADTPRQTSPGQRPPGQTTPGQTSPGQKPPTPSGRHHLPPPHPHTLHPCRPLWWTVRILLKCFPV